MAHNPLALDVKHFRSAVESHAQDWGVTDRALYNLCCDQPGHRSLSAVNAKALLIGRGFATGIERHIKSSGGQGNSIRPLAAHLHKNSTLAYGIISRLSKLHYRLYQHALP